MPISFRVSNSNLEMFPLVVVVVVATLFAVTSGT